MEFNINDLVNNSKIPDPIKMIAEYNGNSKSLTHWISSVDRTVEAYEVAAQNRPDIFAFWVGVIRTRCVGKAHDALVSRSIGNDWPAIRSCLIEFFGDRREIPTLCQKIPLLQQNGRSVEAFYNEANDLTAAINQKVSLDPRYAEATNEVMLFVRDMMTHAFMDGLNPPYNLTVRGMRPESLEVAKTFAEEQMQATQRNTFFAREYSKTSQNLTVPNNARQNPRQNRQNGQPIRQNKTFNPQNPHFNAAPGPSGFANKQNFQNQNGNNGSNAFEANNSMRSRQGQNTVSMRSANQINCNEQDNETEQSQDQSEYGDYEDNQGGEAEINFCLVDNSQLIP